MPTNVFGMARYHNLHMLKNKTCARKAHPQEDAKFPSKVKNGVAERGLRNEWQER